MKTGSGRGALGCTGAVLAVIAALVWGSLHWRDFLPRTEPLADFQPVSETRPEPARPEPEGGADDRIRLIHGFSDHDGQRHVVSCTVRRRDYEREVASYGYLKKEMDRELGRRIEILFFREAEARGLREHVDFEVYDGTGYRWSWELPAGLNGAEVARLQEELREFDQWLDRDLLEMKAAIMDRYLRERGLRLKDAEIVVDYEGNVRRGTGPLRDCFEALRRAGDGAGEQRLLSLFLAFFQELEYELPPDVESGRRTLGFRVPTAVLVQGGGDCDSKSAAFCALWRNLPRRSILILIPEHALVGVEAKPGPDQAYVRLGNRYFVLCEVSGPAKVPPGGEAFSGSFEYVMIEPVS